MKNVYSYCIDNNNKFQKYQINDIKKDNKSNFNKTNNFLLNSLKGKKEKNELEINNIIISKTNNIINSSKKENEDKLTNLPLNHDFSNRTKKSKNRKSNNELIQKNKSKNNSLDIKNRVDKESRDKNKRIKDNLI